MDYSKLSDVEVDREVAKALGLPWLFNADDEWLCVPEDTEVDGITGDGVQMIYSGAGAVHANPLRAAMVMFLTIQDESNADV